MINPKVFKQVRKALGLTQQELADSLQLSRVTINKMEKGRLKRGIPDDIAARLLSLRPNVKAILEEKPRLPNWHPEWKDDHLWDNEEDES